jgi:hypothetical protein
VGSKTFEGVRFSVYPNDHLPPHVHGTCEGVVVIVDLLANGEVKLSARKDRMKPLAGKRNAVAKILRVAGQTPRN